MIKFFFSSAFVFLTFFSFSASGVQEFTVAPERFYEGAAWVWSYSEKKEDSSEYQKPYLYEKYEVVKNQKGLITIEMSSGPDPTNFKSAHHKFIADVEDCLERGSTGLESKLRSWKIAFYTKSIEKKWSLVDKRFKNLAFTEKFNCFSFLNSGMAKKINFKEESLVLYRANLKSIKTWYVFGDSSLAGVGVLRFPKNYKMELEDSL